MKNTDFLPQWYVDRLVLRQYSRRNLVWSLAIVAALGTLYATNAARIRSAVAMLADYQEEHVRQGQTRARMEALIGRKSELEREVALLSRIDDHAPVDLVMAELVAHLSDSMAIRSLELERMEDDAKSPPGADAQKTVHPKRYITRVRIRGVAPSDVEIGTFYGKLSSSPLFDRVELHFTRGAVEHNREMRSFEISFSVLSVYVNAENPDGNGRE